jgi:formylglycine-generating enzyme required for sulfatase activity
VTIGEYRGCIDAGTCKPPRETACNDWPERTSAYRPNFHLQDVPSDAAATCVGLTEAEQYCTWVGGKLPTLTQWLLAARGRSPQRFSWGAATPTCEHHPFADLAQAERCEVTTQGAARIGLHAQGASPLGIQDVLLTPGELLETSSDALFSACLDENRSQSDAEKGCIVYGLKPGAIDSVEELWSRPKQPDTTATVYGFRCTWGGTP